MSYIYIPVGDVLGTTHALWLIICLSRSVAHAGHGDLARAAVFFPDLFFFSLRRLHCFELGTPFPILWSVLCSTWSRRLPVATPFFSPNPLECRGVAACHGQHLEHRKSDLKMGHSQETATRPVDHPGIQFCYFVCINTVHRRSHTIQQSDRRDNLCKLDLASKYKFEKKRYLSDWTFMVSWAPDLNLSKLRGQRRQSNLHPTGCQA